MANRYHVKSATLTFGTASYDMAAAPIVKGETKEAVDVTALSDAVKQFIPGAVKEIDELTVTLFDKGTGMPSVDDEPKQLSLTVQLSDGTSSTPVNANVTYPKAIVTKVSPPSQDATGDRKATVDVTFRPDGSAGSSSGSGGSGSGGSGSGGSGQA